MLLPDRRHFNLLAVKPTVSPRRDDKLFIVSTAPVSLYVICQRKKEKHHLVELCFTPPRNLAFSRDLARAHYLTLLRPVHSRIDAICLSLICLPDVILGCWCWSPVFHPWLRDQWSVMHMERLTIPNHQQRGDVLCSLTTRKWQMD